MTTIAICPRHKGGQLQLFFARKIPFEAAISFLAFYSFVTARLLHITEVLRSRDFLHIL